MHLLSLTSLKKVNFKFTSSTVLLLSLAIGFAQVVTKTADTNDGICDADCSLREAIATSNDGDTIIFDASLAGQTITLDDALGELAINFHSMKIDAHALSNKVIIERSIDSTNDFRIFNHKGTGTFEIDNLIVRHGSIANVDDDVRTFVGTTHGGGISSDGNIVLRYSIISDNSSWRGGGINARGDVVVISSNISKNTVRTDGGGIRSGGKVSVRDSVVSENYSRGVSGFGAGVFGHVGVDVIRSTVSENVLGGNSGAGVHGNGDVRIVESNIIENSTEIGSGGGVSSFSSIKVTNSVISGNIADSVGGGINHSDANTLTLVNTVVSGNSGGRSGGGIHSDGKVRIRNSLISGNIARHGGGIMCGESVIENSTIVSNKGEYGAAIFCTLNIVGRKKESRPNNTTTITNSIILGNISEGRRAINGPFSLDNSGYGFLDGESTGNLFTGKTMADIFVSPEPASSAPTTTGDYRLAVGSPAVDAGDDSLVPTGRTTDIDGNTRIQGVTVDMGAYEAAPATTGE